jgi:hypothetical protein
MIKSKLIGTEMDTLEQVVFSLIVIHKVIAIFMFI